MPHEVIMPVLGMNQDTGTLLRWLRREGDAVAVGDPVMEIATDKITVEIESPADGVLAGLSAAEGEEVPVGRAVAWVLEPGESVPADTPSHLGRARACPAGETGLSGTPARCRRLAVGGGWPRNSASTLRDRRFGAAASPNGCERHSCSTSPSRAGPGLAKRVAWHAKRGPRLPPSPEAVRRAF